MSRGRQADRVTERLAAIRPPRTIRPAGSVSPPSRNQILMPEILGQARLGFPASVLHVQDHMLNSKEWQVERIAACPTAFAGCPVRHCRAGSPHPAAFGDTAGSGDPALHPSALSPKSVLENSRSALTAWLAPPSLARRHRVSSARWKSLRCGSPRREPPRRPPSPLRRTWDADEWWRASRRPSPPASWRG